MKKDNTLWILIAAVAAVAAATTIVILVVRARQKAAKLVEPIYDCGCCGDTCCDDAVECACAEETQSNTDNTATE